jgi:hypothetical protein
MNKKVVWMLALPFAPFLVGFGLPTALPKLPTTILTQQVTLSSLDPLFGIASTESGMTEDPVKKANVIYPVTSVGKYDAFFKKSAELKGSLIASTEFTTVTMANMKATARSAAAKSALGASIREVVGSKPESRWTVEDTGRILKLEKKKGEVTEEQMNALRQSAVSVTAMTALILKAPTTVIELATMGRELSGSVSTDFAGSELANAPKVATALTDSAGSLKEAGEQAKVAIKELSRLGAMIAMALD